MMILGKTNDDKGTQLEEFVKAVLVKLGYTNVGTNIVGSGADEVDVSGEFHIPQIVGSPISVPIIGECKAYKNPVDLPVLLKFLGKLYLEEKKGRANVHGVLVALAGANGNCIGAFKELKRHTNTLQLITQEELQPHMAEMHGATNEKSVSSGVAQLTSRTIIKIEMAYYQNRVYWYIRFDDSNFTLLGGNGASLLPDQAAPLVEMVARVEPDGEYIDLKEEVEAKKRRLRTRTFFLSDLVMSPRRRTIAEIRQSCECDEPTILELATELKELGFVDETQEGFGLLALAASNRVDFLRCLFGGGAKITVLASDGYRVLIDDDLVEAILQLQGDCRMPAAEKAAFKRVIQVSPSALGQMLQPHPMVASHADQRGQSPEMDELDMQYLLDKVLRCLEKDMHVNELMKQIHQLHDVVELDQSVKWVIKGRNAAHFEVQYRDRLLIAELADELTNGVQTFAPVRLRNDAPDPWDHPPDTAR